MHEDDCGECRFGIALAFLPHEYRHIPVIRSLLGPVLDTGDGAIGINAVHNLKSSLYIFSRSKF